MNTTLNLTDDFEVHPRKRVSPTPLRDWAGRPLPRTIGECYGRYSVAKQHAYDYCRKLFDKYDGADFIITSYNTFSFTASFDFSHPQTGEAMRAIITRDHNHVYYIG